MTAIPSSALPASRCTQRKSELRYRRAARAGRCLPHALSLVLAVLLVDTPAHAQDVTARIDSIFSFVTSETPGCAMGVSRDGRVIVTRAYGLAEVERNVPMSARSGFDIGSVHKQFVAAAVLLLVEQGRLSLSDDIRVHLPELPDYGHTITVDHLLTHTGGIRDWVGLLPLAEEGADVLQLILRQRGVNFVPGEAWSYSNSGYVLLKEIVARVSGNSFAEFTRSRLFEPLGMRSSSYVSDILQASGERAFAYQKEGTGWTQYMRLGNERAGGGVISTPGDLLIWNDALASGRLGAYVTGKLQEAARLNNGRRLSYARGLHLSDIPGGPLVWHDGGSAGYGTWLGRFMDHDLSIAVSCNFEPVSVSTLVSRVAHVFLPAVDPQTQPPEPIAAPGVEVAGRGGLYFAERSGEPLRLNVNSGRLVIAGGPPLVPVSADRFRPARASIYYRSGDEFALTFQSTDTFELKSMEGQTARYHRARPWTPTEADLQSVDGRYGSEDLGTVFEILPGTNGIGVRFERSPEMMLEMEPVARDTYMRSLVVVRFLRDSSGAVTGFDYSNPMARNIAFTRLGERAMQSPPVPVTADQIPPAAGAQGLNGLVGEYEMGPGRTLAITLEGGRLHGQLSGSGKRVMTHVSGTTFSPANSPMTLTFTVGPDARATAVVMRQAGMERTLPRVR